MSRLLLVSVRCKSAVRSGAPPMQRPMSRLHFCVELNATSGCLSEMQMREMHTGHVATEGADCGQAPRVCSGFWAFPKGNACRSEAPPAPAG
jgi:hypothetical protein